MSAVSNSPIDPRLGWKSWRVVFPVLLILCAHLFFKMCFERAEILPYLSFPEILDGIINRNPLRILLPIPINEAGEVRWTTTGLVLVDQISRLWGYQSSYLILSSVLLISVYFLSWHVFGSVVFSSTFALLMAFGAQFNRVFGPSSVLLLYPFFTFISFNLFFAFYTVRFPAESRWKIGFVVSLILAALCWEMWLDYGVYICVGICFAYHWLRRSHRNKLLRGARFVGLITGVILISYLAIRLRFADQFVEPGREAELVFTYPHWMIIVEDVVSNVFTYIYMSLMNYVPGVFQASNALRWYGPEKLMQYQNGFMKDHLQFVAMHYFFYWYFYAGALTAGFLYWFVRVLTRSFTMRSTSYFIASQFLLLIAFGFSTHLWIKFRAYLSVPILEYKCAVSIFGVSLLISFLTMKGTGRLERRSLKLALVAFVWFTVIISAFTRPLMQRDLAKWVDVAPPPDPTAVFRR